jgi:ABC-type Fe3+ transport system substrate-binding protein
MQAGVFDYDVMYSETELIPRFEKLGLVIDPFDWQGAFGIHAKMMLPKGYGIMIGSNPAGIAYNKEKVAKAHVPKKWLDACDPYFKGKVAVDIRPIHMISLMAVYPQEWVLDYAKKLLANNPVWIRGQTAANTLLAAGEVWMTAPASHGSWYRARQTVLKKTPDWPVEFVIPEGPVGCEAGLQLLPMKKASNPNAAMLLAGWLASKGVVHLDTGRESVFHSGTKLSAKLKKLGLKAEVQGWELQANSGDITKKILEIWGFPKASK